MLAGVPNVRSASSQDTKRSQTTKATLGIRELVLDGELAPGERVPEVGLSERLGISRTPLRIALTTLAHEGLLEPLSGGGFIVRSFTRTDIADAIELRGVLEGTAARLAGSAAVVAGGTAAHARDPRDRTASAPPPDRRDPRRQGDARRSACTRARPACPAEPRSRAREPRGVCAPAGRTAVTKSCLTGRRLHRDGTQELGGSAYGGRKRRRDGAQFADRTLRVPGGAPR